jgi:hypothetical protein
MKNRAKKRPAGPTLSIAEIRRRWEAWRVLLHYHRLRWMALLRQRLRRARRIGARKLALAHDRSATAFGKLSFAAIRILLLLTAPFMVLIRGAVWLNVGHAFPTWLALLASGGATLALLTLYATLASRRFTGRARLGLMAKWVAAPLVVGYCGYALLYLSRVNAKDDTVRSVYTATHPLLRVAVTTLILADRDAVITDLARAPDDYRRMGLPVNQRSLHYPQADGWVHAVDLRTRGPLRSLLVEWYFGVMGFDTLRHTGTADHLHVSLPPPTR